ncbi:MAG: glycosyltransferase family 2 protein [Candidatus Omnitrophica bacterium]|jgi:glycosyltransferase involved in cell wall biosynthesis|nr:glycosyltransferase family 2 protein [Candidatus Omnitrophota bacterium]
MIGSKEKFSILIPVHNEGKRIKHNLEEVKRTLDNLGCNYEIIAIDDGSSDDTAKILQELVAEIPNLIINSNQKNFGKGRALKKAFKYASGDLIVWLDADLDLHPFQIKTLYDIMVLDDADIVIGSKMHPNSKVDYPFNRRIISLGYYYFIRLLFNLPCHDTQTGLKLFRRRVLEAVFPRILVKKFAFDLEVLVNSYKLGFKLVEAPIVLDSQRPFGRIGINSIFTTLWDTIAIWYRMYILRYYDRIDYHRRRGLLREFKRVRQ